MSGDAAIGPWSPGAELRTAFAAAFPRLYHVTALSNLDSIRQHGLSLERAKALSIDDKQFAGYDSHGRRPHCLCVESHLEKTRRMIANRYAGPTFEPVPLLTILIEAGDVVRRSFDVDRTYSEINDRIVDRYGHEHAALTDDDFLRLARECGFIRLFEDVPASELVFVDEG